MARALQIVRHGEPEELVLAEVRVPAPGADEITIDVHAAGVNFPDLLVVRGTYQNLAPLPFSPGKEVAGIVSAVGACATEFQVGDPVLAYVENGGYVDQITVPSSLCHPMPDGLDAADAIGIGLAFQTAHFALLARGQMKSGETVLVTGATGGVGIATVQLAKACGAIVIAGCSTASKAGFARDHGADHVVMLDRPDLEQSLKVEIAALTGGRGADVVVGFAAGAPATLRSNYLLIKNIAAVGLHWSDYRDRTPALIRNAQQEVFALWRQGLLSSPVTDALRLDDAALALRRIADRQVRGKIVLLTERYAGRLAASPDPVRS